MAEIGNSVDIQKNMREVGIPEDKLEYLATKATEWGDTGTMCPINKDEALEVYTMAWS